MGDYSAARASGDTTLARCFILTTAAGDRQGFTSHDRDLVVGGVTCLAGAALTASETATRLGLAPDDLDASGALSADTITEDGLAAGDYDGAQVELWDVDWTDTSTRRLLGRYSLGQVERGPAAFRAELRGATAKLDVQQGRIYSQLCDVVELGDARCGTNLASATALVTVTDIDDLTLSVTGSSNPSGHWDRGRLTFFTGDAAGRTVDVRASLLDGGVTRLSIWRLPGRNPGPGDQAFLLPGCDRTYETCRNKFQNTDNFRGFPHMPGEAFVTEYARPGDAGQNGGSRFG